MRAEQGIQHLIPECAEIEAEVREKVVNMAAEKGGEALQPMQKRPRLGPGPSRLSAQVSLPLPPTPWRRRRPCGTTSCGP